MKLPQYINRFIITTIIFISAVHSNAQTGNTLLIDTTVYKIIKVKPSVTNAAITYWDTVHVIYYDPTIKSNKLLLWLTGTNGTTRNVPEAFFKTALEKGYRIISLSFISIPAVAAICRGDNLQTNVNCAADFRRKRIYGDNDFSLIPDQPQDAIVPRLVKLLQYLSKYDAAGNWQQYMEKKSDKPNWKMIAIAGQSQGGGMAEFIAQYENIARVISFSGGWDFSNSTEKKIAGWYFNNNVTPMEKWYATYNIKEQAATSIKEICQALKIPTSHVFALDKPLGDPEASGNANPYHGDGIRNIAYKDIWVDMLGSGL